MRCTSIDLSLHGVTKMIERGIDLQSVMRIADDGEIIRNYPDDKPHASRLVLGWIAMGTENRPVHVVLAQDMKTGKCIIVTAYWPDPVRWTSDFKTKK